LTLDIFFGYQVSALILTKNGLHGRRFFNKLFWGQFFVHFLPRKITFRGITWENDFSKLFPQKIAIFPNIFGGKFSLEKMYEKSAPGYPEASSEDVLPDDEHSEC
jgi:hypothetical protein